jgi:hypothetical protein
MEIVCSYPAVKIQQSNQSSPLVLLAAPATEIHNWAGVPQKTRVVKDDRFDVELLGFQRDDDPDRTKQIARFYSDPHNVIQNPLLCAIRSAPEIDVEFSPHDQSDTAPMIPGKLTIKYRSLSDYTLLDLLKGTRNYLEERVPSLASRSNPVKLIQELGKILGGDEAETHDDEELQESGFLDDEEPLEEALFSESHITEFWDQLSARIVLMEKIGETVFSDEFLGFTRDAMEVYLKPIILVDGQHRLIGALTAAKEALDADESRWETIRELTNNGKNSSDINELLLTQKARYLPISLLMNEKADEHVFQFVVVNQKATPVRAALLGTIISTSLADEELQRISERLENAGIPLQNSVAATFFAKNERSPFAGLVARGLKGDGSDLLPWSVLGQLISVFRNLSGARYFHDSKLDYADVWRRKFLEQSSICQEWVSADQKDAYAYWSQQDGPWREVFIYFWEAVRNRLANTTNESAGNYWGRPRTSNLFNKPSLLILTTDFFAYLVESRGSIDSAETIGDLVNDWLIDVNPDYFARNWKLEGVKKDSTGIRKQWSSLWYSYRRDPRRVPNDKQYSTVYKG